MDPNAVLGSGVSVAARAISDEFSEPVSSPIFDREGVEIPSFVVAFRGRGAVDESVGCRGGGVFKSCFSSFSGEIERLNFCSSCRGVFEVAMRGV